MWRRSHPALNFTRTKPSFCIASLCTRRRRIPASTSKHQGSKEGDLIVGGCAAEPSELLGTLYMHMKSSWAGPIYIENRTRHVKYVYTIVLGTSLMYIKSRFMATCRIQRTGWGVRRSIRSIRICSGARSLRWASLASRCVFLTGCIY